MCANYNRITTLIFEYEVKNERFLSKIVYANEREYVSLFELNFLKNHEYISSNKEHYDYVYQYIMENHNFDYLNENFCSPFDDVTSDDLKTFYKVYKLLFTPERDIEGIEEIKEIIILKNKELLMDFNKKNDIKINKIV